MARDESSREDLLREATALVERIELVPRSVEPQHIVAGFRRDGALSIFFGEDPVYQFNSGRELRRAYRQGKLLKAIDGRLIALDRVRTQDEVQLVRRELSDDEQEKILREMVDRMGQLSDLLSTNGFEVAGQVPPDADVLGRLQTSLKAHQNPRIAAKPNA